jgi:hypothetical protein
VTHDNPAPIPYGETIGLSDIAEAFAELDPDLILPIGIAEPHSYRGYYAELAVELTGPMRAGDIADMLHGCVGRTFQGYKGGNYTMYSSTDVYIAEYGRAGGDLIGPVLLHFLTHQTPVKETGQ